MRRVSLGLILLALILIPVVGLTYLWNDGPPGPRTLSHTLTSGEVLARSWIVEHDGLDAVRILIRPGDQASGKLRVRVGIETDFSQQFHTQFIEVDKNLMGEPLEFSMPVQLQSRGRRVEVSLHWAGDGELLVGGDPRQIVYKGRTTLNGEVLDIPMWLELDYDRGARSRGWRSFVGFAAGQLLAMFWLLTIPGAALLTGLWRGWGGYDRLAQIVLSTAAGLAIYPILLIWARLMGWAPGSSLSWLVPVLSLGFLAWRDRHDPRVTRRLHYSRTSLRNQFIFAVVILLLVASRLGIPYSLETPMWGDSVHHTLITQLLIDNGGLFDSWLPYANLDSFTYHFGFHSFAANLHGLSSLPADQAVLWAGQLLNLLAVLVLYPLAARVSGRQEAGMLAVIVAGLAINMPNYYTNWGRYTQLAGQVLLLAFAVFAWELVQKNRGHRRTLLVAGVLLAGLALTHYRITVFAILFLLAAMFMEVRWRRLGPVFYKLFLLALLSAGLVLPWGLNVLSGKLIALIEAYATTPAADQSAALIQYNAIAPLETFLPIPVWIFFGLSAIWALIGRHKRAALILVWWALILLTANPGLLGLPGAGILTNFAVFLGAYIPASILISTVISEGFPIILAYSQGFVRRRWRWAVVVGVLEIVLLLTAFGTVARFDDINVRRHSLVMHADRIAATWLSENTNEDSLILVNSFFTVGEGSVVGSDAGWWLPYLADRNTTLPPITYSSESSPDAGYIAWVNALPALVLENGIDDPDVLELLAARGVTHVFIGARDGLIGNRRGPRLDLDGLRDTEHYLEVFELDGATVFEVQRR